MYKCVHCGFCLQACPTYLETGLETESPRGRIALMKAVNEGRIGITPEVYRHWDLCIQCRACEVACPSGVPYGNLIEATMSQVERRREKKFFPRLLGNLVLNGFIPHQRRLEILASGLRLYQWSGLQAAIRKTKVLAALAPGLAELEMSAPAVSKRRFKARGQVVSGAGGSACEGRHTVGVRDAADARASRWTPQCVCSHGTAARWKSPRDRDAAAPFTVTSAISTRPESLLETISKPSRSRGVDAVIVASAGCGARMKEYGHLLQDDPEYADRASRFSGTVKDIHEFLVDLPFTPPTASVDKRVTYQDSCHLANAQRVTDAPRTILTSIPGVESGRDGAFGRVLRRGRDVHDHGKGILASRARLQDAERWARRGPMCWRLRIRDVCSNCSMAVSGTGRIDRGQVRDRLAGRGVPAGGRLSGGTGTVRQGRADYRRERRSR